MNIFEEARIKLTAFYLLVMMAASLAFSVYVYESVTVEFVKRYDVVQKRYEINFPGTTSSDGGTIFIVEDIYATRNNVLVILLYANVAILIFSGIAGYFLAGVTLKPIKKNMDEQKDFVSNASHELRTPLTSIKTEIEVALRDKDMNLSAAKELLRSNLEEVDKMKKLADYLLKLNKFSVDTGSLRMKEVDLKKVAAKAIGKRKVKAELKKAVVKGNEESITELISILLDNAFKYTLKNPKITVRTYANTLEVNDNGVGIPQEDLNHIFDRFYRAEKSRTKDGYGLGLSIAKSIVDAHGAKISVESKVGKGSKFKVVFGK